MAVQGGASIMLSAERCQDLVRKRLVEVRADANSALQPPGPAGLDSEPDELRDGPATFRDDDFFSLRDSLEKAREVGLGVVNVEDSHTIYLAKLVYSFGPELSSASLPGSATPDGASATAELTPVMTKLEDAAQACY
jgi:hypothetical protein